MVKVAVTGGIGSGKSYVCKLLEMRGISIYDCDKAAKHIMASSEDIQSELKRVVGSDVFSDGKLNKAKLASFLLKTESNTLKINNIIHPAVAEDFIKSGYGWMECAILFSSGFNRLVDKVICVVAPIDVRIGRIMMRDGISRDKAIEWINKQMPQDEVMSLSDYVIENDGKKDLDRQINEILVSLNQTDTVKI